MITTIVPVEARWSYAEFIIAWSLLAFCLFSITRMFLSTRNTTYVKYSLCNLLILICALYYFVEFGFGLINR